MSSPAPVPPPATPARPTRVTAAVGTAWVVLVLGVVPLLILSFEAAGGVGDPGAGWLLFGMMMLSVLLCLLVAPVAAGLALFSAVTLPRERLSLAVVAIAMIGVFAACLLFLEDGAGAGLGVGAALVAGTALVGRAMGAAAGPPAQMQ